MANPFSIQNLGLKELGLDKAVAGIGRTLERARNAGTAAAATSASAAAPTLGNNSALTSMAAARAPLEEYRNMALESARKFAEAQNRQPTLIDYYVAAEQLGAARSIEMQQKGVDWNPRSYADLSGMNISGFMIRERDVNPGAQRLGAALRDAQSRLNGITPGRLDVLQSLQNQQGIEKLEYVYDLDGDDAIAPLYKSLDDQFNNIQNQTAFNNANFEGCTFHPAGTLMQYHHTGAKFTDCTFDGMGENDKVVLYSGEYNNIRMTNINGGELTVGEGPSVTTVKGLSIEGSKLADLNFNSASVSGLQIGSVSITRIGAKDTTFNEPRFENTTLYNSQERKGGNVTFENVTMNHPVFNNVNMPDLTIEGGVINNLEIKDCDLKGLTLNGVEINGATINGVPITDKQQLVAMGIQVDDKTIVHAHDNHQQRTEERDVPLIEREAPQASAIHELNGVGSQVGVITADGINNALGTGKYAEKDEPEKAAPAKAEPARAPETPADPTVGAVTSSHIIGGKNSVLIAEQADLKANFSHLQAQLQNISARVQGGENITNVEAALNIAPTATAVNFVKPQQPDSGLSMQAQMALAEERRRDQKNGQG